MRGHVQSHTDLLSPLGRTTSPKGEIVICLKILRELFITGKMKIIQEPENVKRPNKPQDSNKVYHTVFHKDTHMGT